MENNVTDSKNTSTTTLSEPSITKKEGQAQTYICLGSETNLLEIDLINFREKGQQVRYLAVSFDNKESQTSINLDENSFYVLKSFFAQLEWNS